MMPWSIFLGNINQLVESGVLEAESCPDPTYWHWRVLKPEELTVDLKANYEAYGEIRWY